ncbi:hypothetical protein AAVH_28928 [Aphelenchoides avenae]|nr:hypothetical protein AAVH_36977 [Aphelenchus avenae]KAH7703890.1 hypothetical protein AAVH_28928 [Aphelenchus avenae]
MKEASLQDQARLIQVSADLIASMQTELRKQSTRLVIRCYQRSRCNNPDGSPFNGCACFIERAGLYAFCGTTTRSNQAHSGYACCYLCTVNRRHSGTVRSSKPGHVGCISNTSTQS